MGKIRVELPKDINWTLRCSSKESPRILWEHAVATISTFPRTHTRKNCNTYCVVRIVCWMFGRDKNILHFSRASPHLSPSSTLHSDLTQFQYSTQQITTGILTWLVFSICSHEILDFFCSLNNLILLSSNKVSPQLFSLRE